MDYAMKTGLSLSTLRRYIKAGKIEHRVEEGRYLLCLEGPLASSSDQMEKLQKDLQKAREEIAELKTLIALYEEHPPGSSGSSSPDHSANSA
jgi:hypothetical protein